MKAVTYQGMKNVEVKEVPDAKIEHKSATHSPTKST